MGLGNRNAKAQHERGIAAQAVHSSDWWLFKPGERVMTSDGFPGVVAQVQDGPYPGNEDYEVKLDNGMGGGAYTAGQLKSLRQDTATVEHTADQDYPELGTVLIDRPDIAINAARETFPMAHPSEVEGVCRNCGNPAHGFQGNYCANCIDGMPHDDLTQMGIPPSRQYDSHGGADLRSSSEMPEMREIQPKDVWHTLQDRLRSHNSMEYRHEQTEEPVQTDAKGYASEWNRRHHSPEYHCADCGTGLARGMVASDHLLDYNGNAHHLNNNNELEEHRPVHKNDEDWLQSPDASGQHMASHPQGTQPCQEGSQADVDEHGHLTWGGHSPASGENDSGQYSIFGVPKESSRGRCPVDGSNCGGRESHVEANDRDGVFIHDTHDLDQHGFCGTGCDQASENDADSSGRNYDHRDPFSPQTIKRSSSENCAVCGLNKNDPHTGHTEEDHEQFPECRVCGNDHDESWHNDVPTHFAHPDGSVACGAEDVHPHDTTSDIDEVGCMNCINHHSLNHLFDDESLMGDETIHPEESHKTDRDNLGRNYDREDPFSPRKMKPQDTVDHIDRVLRGEAIKVNMDPDKAACWNCKEKSGTVTPRSTDTKDPCSECGGHMIMYRTDRSKAASLYSIMTEAATDSDFRFHITASWQDVQEKARRLQRDGQITISAATEGTITGVVKGDHYIYETQIQRLPGMRAVAVWQCGCKWAAYAWGRSAPYRRFEGRMCSHALGMHYEANIRGLLGNIWEDTSRPSWLKPWSPVTVQYVRKTVLPDGSIKPGTDINKNRRAVPPGNMRRTFSSLEIQDESVLHSAVKEAISQGDDPTEIALFLHTVGVKSPGLWIHAASGGDPGGDMGDELTEEDENRPSEGSIGLRGDNMPFDAKVHYSEDRCKNCGKKIYDSTGNEDWEHTNPNYSGFHHARPKNHSSDDDDYVVRVHAGEDDHAMFEPALSTTAGPLALAPELLAGGEAAGAEAGAAGAGEAGSGGLSRILPSMMKGKGEGGTQQPTNGKDGGPPDIPNAGFNTDPNMNINSAGIYLPTPEAALPYAEGTDEEDPYDSIYEKDLAPMGGDTGRTAGWNPFRRGEEEPPEDMPRPNPEDTVPIHDTRMVNRHGDPRVDNAISPDKDEFGAHYNWRGQYDLEPGSSPAPQLNYSHQIHPIDHIVAPNSAEYEHGIPAVMHSLNSISELQDGLGYLNGSQSPSQPQQEASEIAAAAKQFLAKTALKDFTLAEQMALISEGEGVTASNLDRLDITGTHYSFLEEALAKQDEEDPLEGLFD